MRFNTETFNSEIKVDLRLNNGTQLNRYIFSDGNKLNYEDVSVVWNRRIHNPDATSLFRESEINKWIDDETQWAMNMSFTLFQCPVVNPWEVNERLKFNKMFQMKIASDIGFDVPKSIVTNSIAEIKNFWEEVNGEMIFKKIRKGLFQFDSGKRMILHTNKINKNVFNGSFLDRMKYCPVFLQEHIEKKYDIRSIVINGQVFSFAIFSQEDPRTQIDYRTAGVMGDFSALRHEKIDLGSQVNAMILKFTKYFGLTFSAFDFILSKDDRLIFLEDNPNGQWAWLEFQTGFPLSKYFAQALIDISAINKQ